MNFNHFFGQDKKLFIKVIAGVILLVIAFAFYLVKDITSANEILMSEIPEDKIETDDRVTESAIKENVMIIVDVAGAVTCPTIVKLPEGSRVYEAIDKAGGLSANADTRATNLAEILSDGQKLYIPTKQELEGNENRLPGGTYSFNAATGQSATMVNINTADSDSLQQLTGVGPATAEKIINYRKENGKFNSIEEIKNVSGIGDKTFDKFKDKIKI